MPKRIASALLWFYATWTAWAFVAWTLSLDPVAGTLMGPLLGAVAAGLFAGDPRRVIWIQRAEAASAESATAQAPRRRRIPDPA